jgi:hypothetical protein
VPRIRYWALLVVLWNLSIAAAIAADAPYRSDAVLPETTVGYVSAASYDTLKDRWGKTQLGKLVADPVMQPFVTEFQSQAQKNWASLSESLGLKTEDFKGVVGGEIASALIEPKPATAAGAMLIDITGREKEAQAMLAKARRNLLAEGAKESTVKVGSVTLTVFDVPLPKEEQAAAATDTKAGEQPVAAAAQPTTRQTIYFIAKRFFVSSDNLAVARGMAERLAGGTQAGSLAEVVGYQKVMKRCATDEAGKVSQAKWFIYPLGFAEAARAATPKDKRRKGKTILEIMRHQGTDAMQGVGGYLDFSHNGFELVHRTAIYAPKPYVKAMKMAVLPNAAEFTPQTWVPRDIATYTTAYVDILNAFDNFGSLYDEIIGEPGLWAQTLRGMKEDPDGPKIDLRAEFIVQLGQRVTMVSDYKLPITTSSERLLFAISVKDEKAVAHAVEKSIKNDPGAKKRIIGGRVVWEIVEEEDAAVPNISLEAPSLTPRKKKAKDDEAQEEEDEKEAHFLPHAAITVAHGNLLVASHLDFLIKVLKPVEPRNMLRNNREFQQVWKTAEPKLPKTQCGRAFSWTDEEYRTTYELIRQGKMPQSESLLGRLLNTLAGTKKGTVRQQRIHGAKLPDYQAVRRSLGPAALAVSSESDGWFIKGMLLTR